MNIQVFKKNLLPPQNVIISYPRDNSHIVVTWDEVRNPDKHVLNKEIKKALYHGIKPSYHGMIRLYQAMIRRFQGILITSYLYIFVNDYPLLS